MNMNVNVNVNEKDKRTGWLKELKVGDHVSVFESHTNNMKGYAIIKKITPTGKMDVSRYRFEPNGTCVTRGFSVVRESLILRPFDRKEAMELKERIEHQKRCERLNNFDFKQLQPDSITKIISIIEEK